MCCVKIMILKKRAPFQYFKVEVCPNILSFMNIIGGLLFFVVVLVWVLGLLVWLGFFHLYKYLKIVFIVYAGLAYTELYKILFCIYSYGLHGQCVSDGNIFSTCSLQMTAWMGATADSPKLTEVWVLVLLWVRLRFQVRVWVLRLPDGWQRLGVVWLLLRNSISVWDL